MRAQESTCQISQNKHDIFGTLTCVFTILVKFEIYFFTGLYVFIAPEKCKKESGIV